MTNWRDEFSEKYGTVGRVKRLTKEIKEIKKIKFKQKLAENNLTKAIKGKLGRRRVLR